MADEEIAMRWGDMRESQNVEDRTGTPGPGGGGFGFGGMKLGIGSLILIVIGSLIFGINPLEILGLLGGGAPAPQQTAPAPGYGPKTGPGTAAPSQAKPENQDTAFSRRVLGDTEDVWTAVFKAGGTRYEPPKLVLFRGGVRSACGQASAAVGPFYCSGDRTLYLDTVFFQELHNRFGAPGDFAQAYVIAHEVGHHVQNLLGTMRQFDAQSQRADTRTKNDLSVRLELQADCYAGVWGFFAQKRNLLEAGDVEEGLRAAAAVGDDQIQRRTQGYAVPESFTHGSAQQRMRWFKVGFDSGDLRTCNTFEARQI
jgi:predicted metalloprotease